MSGDGMWEAGINWSTGVPCGGQTATLPAAATAYTVSMTAGKVHPIGIISLSPGSSIELPPNSVLDFGAEADAECHSIAIPTDPPTDPPTTATATAKAVAQTTVTDARTVATAKTSTGPIEIDPTGLEPTDPNNGNNESSKKKKGGLSVGPIVGAAGAFVAILVLVFFFVKMRSKEADSAPKVVTSFDNPLYDETPTIDVGSEAGTYDLLPAMSDGAASAELEGTYDEPTFAQSDDNTYGEQEGAYDEPSFSNATQSVGDDTNGEQEGTYDEPAFSNATQPGGDDTNDEQEETYEQMDDNDAFEEADEDDYGYLDVDGDGDADVIAPEVVADDSHFAGFDTGVTI
jgi:hypothetical protein